MKLLTVLLTLAVLSGCAKKQNEVMIHHPLPDTATYSSTNTYLALGDSYTIGESVPETSNFPNQLATSLNRSGRAVAAPVIIARTGWTTDDLVRAIKEKGLTDKFGFVTLLIGVNNQYRGLDIAIYKQQFAELLGTALQYAGGDKNHVFVVSIPDYSVTPFARYLDQEKISNEIDQYNAIARTACKDAGISFTDITPVSRGAAADPELVAPDGLHPSGKMYSKWVELLAPTVTQHIKK